MKKTELNKLVENYKLQTKEALQIMYDALNQGQQKQVLKDEKVKKLFDLYGIEY